MPKKFFLIFFFFLILLNSALAISLNSLTLNPSISYPTDSVSASGNVSGSTISADLNQFLSNASTEMVGSSSWVCQSFLAPNNEQLLYINYADTSTSIFYRNARIYEYISNSEAGDLLATSDGNSVFWYTDTLSRNWDSFRNWDSNINFIQNEKYYFCMQDHTSGTSGFHWTFNTNPYSNGFATYGIADSNLSIGVISGSVGNDPLADLTFIIQTVNNELTKLRCGDSTGVYNLCTSGSFVSENPSCSFSNPFNAGDINNIFCQAFSADNTSNELSSSLTTIAPLTDFLTCTGVQNVKSCIVDLNAVYVVPNDETKKAIFYISNSSLGFKNFPLIMKNSLKDGKQYTVFSSNDGINYSLDDTFSYGSIYNTPIQKIYSEPEQLYYYSQNDIILGASNNYYKYEYQSTANYWDSMYNNSDWDIQLNPFKNDVNGVVKDLYQVSTYNNIRNKLINKIPDVTSNFTDNFLLQFNSYYDNASTQNLSVGEILPNGSDNTSSYSISSNEHRYNFTVNPDHPLVLTNNSSVANVYAGEYALINRGYFTKDLEIKTQDNLSLPIGIGDSNNYFQYLLEGQKFRIDTEILDTDGNLDFYEIEVYIDGVNDNNMVNYYRFDWIGQQGVNTRLNDLISGVFDLTANAPDRLVKIVLRVNSNTGNYSEVQSKWLKLFQFPHFPDDLVFTFNQINKKIGDNPQGTVNLRVENSDLIRGINFQIQDSITDNNSADYNITLYKGKDFFCKAFDCSFNYKFDEYIFPKQDNFRMTGRILTTTESDTTTNQFMVKTISFQVYFKAIETARIFEGIERGDHTYRNDEEIFLTLQMRDSDYSNLRNDFKTILTYSECDTQVAGGTNCREIDVNFSPDSHVYDQATGYNYWFFRDLFFEEDLSLLSDGNYFRFYAVVEDVRNKHEAIIKPLLTTRCVVTDPTTAWGFSYNMNEFAYGCLGYQSPKVTLDFNTVQENRLFINNNRVVIPPTQEALICAKPNNATQNTLSQDLDCQVLYTLGESLPDKFKLYITNKNSDLAEQRDDYKQFIELSIPYEQIIFNDPYLLKQSLEADGTGINTLGDAVFWGFNKLISGIANPLIDFGLNVFVKDANGVFINFGADVNLSAPYDPDHISGIMFYKIKGLKVININDYKYKEDLQDAPAKNFIKYISQQGYTIPNPKTSIKVYTSDFTEAINETVSSKLVINEEPTLNEINVNTDSNFAYVPVSLKFDIVHDLIYNNERTTLRAFIPFTLITTIKSNISFIEEWANGLTGVFDGSVNPVEALINFTFQNILIITILLMIAIIFTYIGFIGRG